MLVNKYEQVEINVLYLAIRFGDGLISEFNCIAVAIVDTFNVVVRSQFMP